MWTQLSKAYINHAPAHIKQAATLKDQHAFLNPTGNALADYGIYGGAGALGGAGIGALINLLRDEDVLTGALIGGGAGLGLGLGGKAIVDANMRPSIAALLKHEQDQNAILNRYNARGENLLKSKENNPELLAAQERDKDLLAQGGPKRDMLNKARTLAELLGI